MFWMKMQNKAYTKKWRQKLVHAITLKFFGCLWRVTEYATPKYNTFTEGIFWAESNWESDMRETLTSPPLCLKAGYKLAKPSSLLSLPARMGVNQSLEITLGTYEPTDSTRGIYITNLAKRSPYLPLMSPYICIRTLCCPQKFKILFLCLVFTKRLFFL